MATLTVLRPAASLALIAMFVHASTQAALNLSHTHHTFDALIDHFTYCKNATFPLRYAMADQYWNRKGGPIFIYTANEGSIEDHISNTGIMWEWARDFKALLVFPEHRYYGTSLPFGKDSFKAPEMSAYLTTEQALADYVDLVVWLKRNIKGARTSRVAAFGGHHAGMLATWFRTKYPHIVSAALASSAPFKMFSPTSTCDTFYKAVTKIYQQTSKYCPREVKRIWPVLDALASTEEECQRLGERFHLCQRLSSNHFASFRGWIRDSLIGVTLVNFPFRSSQVPPHPLKQCTEFVQPLCGDGVADVFYPTEWDYAKFCQKCRLQFGVQPKVDRLVRALGGFNLNGDLDPWSAYGIDAAPSRLVEYRGIRGGAHCVDLRFSNDRWDPPLASAGQKGRQENVPAMAATGIMWEWAPEFNALVVFAEHRFYGQSLPFGINSYERSVVLTCISSYSKISTLRWAFAALFLASAVAKTHLILHLASEKQDGAWAIKNKVVRKNFLERLQEWIVVVKTDDFPLFFIPLVTADRSELAHAFLVVWHMASTMVNKSKIIALREPHEQRVTALRRGFIVNVITIVLMAAAGVGDYIMKTALTVGYLFVDIPAYLLRELGYEAYGVRPKSPAALYHSWIGPAPAKGSLHSVLDNKPTFGFLCTHIPRYILVELGYESYGVRPMSPAARFHSWIGPAPTRGSVHSILSSWGASTVPGPVKAVFFVIGFFIGLDITIGKAQLARHHPSSSRVSCSTFSEKSDMNHMGSSRSHQRQRYTAGIGVPTRGSPHSILSSWGSTTLDHFAFHNNKTFEMRYVMADQYWDHDGGPIFFYTGNEDEVENFITNTGIMWEWAPEFNALVVFAEHRFYGQSLPFGNKSYESPHHLGYLTSEQALADYADLILHLKYTLPGAEKSAVVAFGGSYGGMLAAWFRVKYPHIVTA
ncbi:hypothetical protein MTO96_027409 [Rhipicephalus appendiculatus]